MIDKRKKLFLAAILSSAASMVSFVIMIRAFSRAGTMPTIFSVCGFAIFFTFTLVIASRILKMREEDDA